MQPGHIAIGKSTLQSRTLAAWISAAILLATGVTWSAGGRAAEKWEEDIALLSARVDVLVDERKYREALQTASDAFNDSAQTFGPAHPATALAQNLIASFFLRLHHLTPARAHAEGAVRSMEHALGRNSGRLVPLLGDLAEACERLGDNGAARAAIDRARAIVEVTGPDTGRHALVLRQSARIALAARAEDLRMYLADLQRALRIIVAVPGLAETELPPTLDLVAEFVIRIAPSVPDQGARRALLDGARSSLQQSLEIRRKQSRDDDPGLVRPLHLLAVIARDEGDLVQAERLFMVAMTQLMKQRFFSLAFETAGVVRDAIVMDVRRRNDRSSLGFCRALLSRMEGLLATQLRSADEEDQIKAGEALRDDFSFCYEVARDAVRRTPDAARFGLESVLRGKAVVLDVQAHVLRSARASPQGAQALAELNALKSAVARLGSGAAEIGGIAREINALRLRMAHARLASAANADLDDVIGRVRIEDVTKALPGTGVLIEFALVPEFDFAAARRTGRSRYMAFVLASSGAITLVDLGESSSIDAAIMDAAEAIVGTASAGTSQRRLEVHRQAQERLAALYRRIWMPLASAVGAADTVVISPDGELNIAPFAAFVDERNRPLVERHRIVYVTSGRDLVRAPVASRTPALDLLLIADPAFDDRSAGPARAEPRVRGRALGVERFVPLPGTGREARDLPGLVAGDAARKRILTGTDATVESVTSARGPRILHIATHGFFLGDDAPVENPLMRSGLAFAGANSAAERPQGDDGLLTAYEITGLDLGATELAVLSACETALGKVRAGEGVFGLRRAFVLAGARTLMMSLWSVADDVTAQQMRAFYQKRRAMPAMEALRQAQLETIKSMTAEFGVAPAFFWAPFIIQGAQALKP